jgi:hypothetical protein
MTAFSAEYRTAKPHGTSPAAACINDGKSAVRFLRANAERMGLDPMRIAAGGGSAGGHIAAATATLDGFDDQTHDTSVSARANALILFNPVSDGGPGGYGHDRVKGFWKAFSHFHNIAPGTPPAIVLLGANNNPIPTATAERFRREMRNIGLRSELFSTGDRLTASSTPRTESTTTPPRSRSLSHILRIPAGGIAPREAPADKTGQNPPQLERQNCGHVAVHQKQRHHRRLPSNNETHPKACLRFWNFSERPPPSDRCLRLMTPFLSWIYNPTYPLTSNTPLKTLA